MEINSKNLTNQFKDYQKKVNKKLEKYAENEERWNYLEVVITIFSITFFVIFAIRPAIVTISSLVGEIKEKEELSQKMQRKINSVIIAQEEFALVQGKRKLLESYLPSDFAISQGIAQVAGVSLESNLPVNQFSVKQIDNMIRPSKDLSGLDFNVTSAGDYGQIKEFLEYVNESRRWLEVENYQINISEDEENPLGLLNFYIKGKFNYWFEENYGQEKNN